MSRSLSWIDAAGWGSLLDRLGMRESVAGTPRADSQPETPEPGRCRPARSVRLEPDRRTPERPRPEALPAPPQWHGALETRLASFGAWARAQAGAQGLFIGDLDGLPLLNLEIEVDSVVVASAFLRALTEFRDHCQLAMDGSGVLFLDGGGVLSLAEVETNWGRFVLGFVGEDALSHRRLRWLADEFCHAFSEKEGGFDE